MKKLRLAFLTAREKERCRLLLERCRPWLEHELSNCDDKGYRRFLQNHLAFTDKILRNMKETST